jgi:xanthine dehydrogenase YagT iron-sulfur-binding subunit
MTQPLKKQGRGVSRRAFIKGLGTGAVGTAVLPRLFAQETIGTAKGDVPVYDRKRVTLTVNGQTRALDVRPDETLLDVLRDRLDLTGAKRVCDRGECGGCTVWLDGEPIYACLYLAIRADGREITTVEGLAEGDKLHPVQEAFIEKDGYQCGFCSPGFIMTSAALVKRNASPSLDEIRQALSGNLCRCGNYVKIYEAVAEAGRKMRRS